MQGYIEGDFCTCLNLAGHQGFSKWKIQSHRSFIKEEGLVGRHKITHQRQRQNHVTLLNSIKYYGIRKDLAKIIKLHDDILETELLQSNVDINISLISNYAKCGALTKSQEVFEGIASRNVVLWTSLISAYSQNKLADAALNGFQQMQEEGILPNAITFATIAKACSIRGLIKKGVEIHSRLSNTILLQQSAMLGTALMDMFAKQGALTQAREVFDGLHKRDVVTWTALISGYTHHGLAEEALDCFNQMQDDGFCPNAITYTCILKACGMGFAKKGEAIHAKVSKQGLLQNNVELGTALIDMYAKCQLLDKAKKVFDELPRRNVVTWNALISGYIQHDLAKEAISCFYDMQDEGLAPDVVTYACILKACGSIKSVTMGEKIHVEVSKKGLLRKHMILDNALVSMYAKCGDLSKAQKVFDELPERDTVTWNALISGYAAHGPADEALKCYEQMQGEGLSPNTITFACVLKACGSIGSLQRGEEICAEILKRRLLEKDITVGNALIDMYARCGALPKAQRVFDELPKRNVISWNTLISGCVQHGVYNEALDHFEQMQKEGISPDATTYTCILKACGCIQSAERGVEIHKLISKNGLLQRNIILSSALVDMYAKCGVFSKAQAVLDDLQLYDIIAWNALLTGYIENGFPNESISCFRHMQQKGISPNAVTYTCVLRACTSTGSIKMGEEIHDEVKKQGLLENNSIVGAVLIDMYVKCGMLSKAQKTFDNLPTHNMASWNALIAGYAQHGLIDETLYFYGRMKKDGFIPDSFTFVSVLKTCSTLGSVAKGEEIHEEVRKQGVCQNNVILGNALVDMYMKCGFPDKAQQIFDELQFHDTISWTTLITGYAQLGQVKMVFHLFNTMISKCVQPDAITFLVLFTACSHAGLVEEGKMFFNAMNNVYNVTPTIDHYNTMVDLFSRAGLFNEALVLIDMLPFDDHLSLWLTLMGACQKWVNVEVGRWAFNHLIQLNQNYSGAYVCMSSIYAAAGMQHESNEVESLRIKNGAWEMTFLVD